MFVQGCHMPAIWLIGFFGLWKLLKPNQKIVVFSVKYQFWQNLKKISIKFKQINDI